MKRYAWWNQYGNITPEHVTARAIEARLDAVIVKAGFQTVRDTLKANNVPFATEVYAYPDKTTDQVRLLHLDIAAGARFAVINAEVEWETLDAAPMHTLIAAFRAGAPTTPIYACTDTRGKRTHLPYQRVLADACDGWMPMIYPKAFKQTPAAAFAAALDGKDFAGKPVIPAIQTYDNIGADAVAQQVFECARHQLDGYSAYTIAHATDAEWSVIIAFAAPSPAERLGRLIKVGDIFTECAIHGLRDEQLPPHVKAAAKYLLQ